MKIIEAYITKTLFIYTAGTAAAWLGIFAFFKFIRQLDDIGQADYSILSAILFVGFDLPSVLYADAPVIILLGCVFALSYLNTTAEITAIRGFGLAVTDISKVVVRAALLFIFVITIIGEFIAPISTEYANTVRAKALGQHISISNRQGFWLKEGDYFINVKKNISKHLFSGVTLIKTNKSNTLAAVISADNATFDGKILALNKGKYTAIDSNQTADNIVADYFDEYNYPSSFKQKNIVRLRKKPSDIAIWNLYQQIQFLTENRVWAGKFEVEFYKRLIKPFTLVAMILLSMLFIFASPREHTVGKKIFLAIMLSLSFELLSRIGSVVSLRFEYNYFLSVSLPTLVVLAFAIFMLRRKSNY